MNFIETNSESHCGTNTFMQCLLHILGIWNMKLESLILFILQNRGGNQNRNSGSHPNLGMGNGRLIPKPPGNQSPIL